MRNFHEQSSKVTLSLKHSACEISMTVWTKIVYDLLSNTSQKTLMVMHIGYNELIEWIILRPNANVNQNLQEIALRGFIDWFVMLVFYTEGVQLVWKAVDNCYDL